MEQINTQWTAFTGAPTSGKSTILRELKNLGLPIRTEFARRFIGSQLKKGKTIEELCADQKWLQGSFLRLGYQEETLLDPQKPYILDRTPIDAVGHHLLRDLDTADVIHIAARHKYRKVFYFEGLPFQDDGVRIEKSLEEVQRLEQCFRQAYAQLEYDVIEVPLFSTDKDESVRQRVDFILTHL